MERLAQKVHKISDETKAVCRLTMKRVYDDGSIVGSAVSSGFLWRKGSKIFVVTNWHCLSGVNPKSNVHLGTFTPNLLMIEMKSVVELNTGAGSLAIKSLIIETPLEDDRATPTWISHPRGQAVDLAAVRVDQLIENQRVFCINDIDYETRWQVEAGHDALIVGYPEGLAHGPCLPVWKRASIASEPDFDFDGEPVFLVDTTGNSGLSGSPVIAQGSGMFAPNKKFDDESIFGSWRRFIGVYAGRMGESGIKTQLGRVWKATEVDTLISAACE